MKVTRPETLLLLNDARGVYIPRDFAQLWSPAERIRRVSGVSDDVWPILEAGPDNRDYWDTWLDVCDSATVHANGVEYFLSQDGDLWLVPKGMEWDEEAEGWRWPLEAANDN
jgi:hypothetical protein